jgi:hypothetical protein
MKKPPKPQMVKQGGSVGDEPLFSVGTDAGRIAPSPNPHLLELMGLAPEIVRSLRALVGVLMMKNLAQEQDRHLMEAQELLIRVDPLRRRLLKLTGAKT